MLQTIKEHKQHNGLPALNPYDPPLSFFELWPRWAFYPPVLLYAFWLSIKFKGLNTITACNPSMPAGGFVGDSKKHIEMLFPKTLRDLMPTTLYMDTLKDVENFTTQQNNPITFPLVCKPDKGCRGAGVQKIQTLEALTEYAKLFPFKNDRMLIQEYVPYEAEAGVFYIRHPDWDTGQIFSLTLKYFPHVYGDGVSTLETLIKNDPRAKHLQKTYLKRHNKNHHLILEKGTAYRLCFAGAHSKGTIFKNGNKYITPAMTAFFDRISKQIPDFYFGRFDVRFKSMSSLETGQEMKIIELNGAGAEATHIWDSTTTLNDAYKTLFQQFHHAYEIGFKNRKRGFKPTPLIEALEMVKQNERNTTTYPDTH